MNNKNMVHIQNGLEFSFKEKWHHEICRHMGGNIKYAQTQKDKCYSILSAEALSSKSS